MHYLGEQPLPEAYLAEQPIADDETYFAKQSMAKSTPSHAGSTI